MTQRVTIEIIKRNLCIELERIRSHSQILVKH